MLKKSLMHSFYQLGQSSNLSCGNSSFLQGVLKKVLFRNVAVFLLRGVQAVKIFWDAEHIYAITRCLAHVPNVSTLA